MQPLKQIVLQYQQMFVGWNEGKQPVALSDKSLAKEPTFSAQNGINVCTFRLDAALKFSGKHVCTHYLLFKF